MNSSFIISRLDQGRANQEARPRPWPGRCSLRVTLFTLLLVALLGACGNDEEPGATGDEDLPTVSAVGLADGMGGLAGYAITENGFDTANGFKLESFEGVRASTTQSLLQEDVDISFDGDLVTTAQLRNQGNEVTTFYPLVGLEATILTAEDSGIDDIADLVGQKVGVAGLDATTYQIPLMMFPGFYAVEAGEFDWQVVPEPAALRLIQRGDLAAGIFGYPEILIGEIELGLNKLWGPAGAEWREEVGGGGWGITMMAHDAWLEENPELAKGVMAAWDAAAEWLQESSSEIPDEFLAEQFGIEDNPDLIEAFGEALASGETVTSEWTEDDIASAQVFLEEAHKAGLLESVPDGVTTRLANE